ncbi:MAG TPA: O-antigen ligase family protein [Ignavibacteria bacterium]|nr:O-antigen ligase family protein [Ignavibacteria bacterium]
MLMLFLYLLIIVSLVILLYDYRSGIITSLMVITNFGEFVYVNPNLEIGDFGGVGTIYFMDLFWIALAVVVFLKKDKLVLLNYKISFLILLSLFIISLIIPYLISSSSIKDTISVIRPIGNFLFLPYFVITVTDIKSFNFLEKVITSLIFIFIAVQVFEYSTQKRIPVRFFEKYSVFYGEDPFAVEFGGIKTGYIWSRIGYLLPFNLFFGCYYFFKDRRNYGLLLLGAYTLSIMIALSRIWIIGFVFFLIVISVFLLIKNIDELNIKTKLFGLLGSFVFIGVVLLYTSSTFNQIFDIFLLRVNSINDLADKTDSSFLGREYILLQMISIWWEYPLFGAGFSSISRRLITNDLGFPNIVTIFGAAGIVMLISFMVQFYQNIKVFIKADYILFSTLASLMLMLTLMSIFSIDMFYFNATGAILFAIGNILLNLAKQEPEENVSYNYAA